MFRLGDELVAQIYRCTGGFPPAERFGLQSQLRRAAVSVPTNIVEGCARRSLSKYLWFLDVALGSASEVRYLLSVASRLGFLGENDHQLLERRYDELVRKLHKLIAVLSKRPDS